MIWANSIAELDYYNHADNSPCYCEQLVYPADLVLQAQYTNATPNPTILIELLSADGLTTYADVTANFEYYFFTVGGTRYCNMRLLSYSADMCLYKCWILRVRIGTWFDKYTQRYCQTTCCDTPRGVTFTGDDTVERLTVGSIPLPLPPTTECGSPMIRIQVDFPCIDKQLGDYFAIPTGQTWGFTKITNIAGKVKQLIREITRNISYNCNTQRAESFIPYRVYTPFAEGTFPTWKLTELESMFHAPVINVTDFENDYEFQFDGGGIAKTIGDSICWELFQLDVTLRTCFIRQTYGCAEDCVEVANNLRFLIPQNYAGGNFYDENRQLIGNYDALLEYYRTSAQVYAVEDITADYENVYAAFLVSGQGYIPTQVYFDNPSPRSRVFGVNTPVSPVVACAMPVIGGIEIIPFVCDVPVIGGIEIIPMTVTEYDIFDFNNWTVSGGSSVTQGANYYNMNITSRNNFRAYTSPITYLINELIGVIQPEGAPPIPYTVTIDANTQVYIDTTGNIYYTGYPTSYGEEFIEVTLTDIYYG